MYNCQEFEIIVQLMMYANIIFKACFKKHKLYTYKISYKIIGVTREKKMYLGHLMSYYFCGQEYLLSRMSNDISLIIQ